MKKIWGIASLVVVSAALSACGSGASSTAEDTSASGSVAGAVGGTLSNTSSSGTVAMLFQNRSMADRLMSKFIPDALASSACPSFKDSGASSGCSSSADTMWLTYGDCSLLGRVTANGVQALTSSQAVSCGTFPNPGANGSLIRQFVTATGGSTPGSMTLTSSRGTEAVIDDATANLGNFDGDSIAVIANGGYGSQVSFNSAGARDQLVLAHHISVSGVFDHSISGTLSVSENPGSALATLNGSVKVYHNLLKVIGTSTLTDVVHNEQCCMPISGSITTVFAAGTNVQPTALGKALIGKSETLTFNGCGEGRLQTYDGNVSDVALTRCL